MNSSAPPPAAAPRRFSAMPQLFAAQKASAEVERRRRMRHAPSGSFSLRLPTAHPEDVAPRCRWQYEASAALHHSLATQAYAARRRSAVHAIPAPQAETPGGGARTVIETGEAASAPAYA